MTLVILVYDALPKLVGTYDDPVKAQDHAEGLAEQYGVDAAQDIDGDWIVDADDEGDD